MATAQKKRRLMGEINVVPYIDVMLVLLVIFMITAPMLNQGVKVDLPQTNSQPIPQDQREPLVVSVDAKGRYFFSLSKDPRTPLKSSVLLKKLSQVMKKQPDRPVYVKGDRHVAYGKVVELMAMIQEVGVPSVGLMTESPEERNGR